MSGQGEVRAKVRRLRALLGGFACMTVLAAAPAGRADDAARQTPSGMPVPRFVVLKFDEVNARAGPGDDHRLLWVYRVRGLPVQVVAETAEWRRICDPEGGLAWIHRRTTDGRQMIMNRGASPVPVFRSREAGAHRVANLSPRSLAQLMECDGGWCQIRADGITGWAQANQLWGTEQTPQCR